MPSRSGTTVGGQTCLAGHHTRRQPRFRMDSGPVAAPLTRRFVVLKLFALVIETFGKLQTFLRKVMLVARRVTV